MSAEVVRLTRPGVTPLSGRALVLNVTYEPISVVSQRRALVLVLGGKAETVAGGDGYVRSVDREFETPSVVRLQYHVRAPFRRLAPLNRRAVFARDNHSCVYCGHSAECIDHVVPRSRGGQHVWENVVASCRSCNLHKGDAYLADTPMRLPRPPAAPPALSWITLSVNRVPSTWTPFLPADVPIPA